jgi:hypothetical protein
VDAGSGTVASMLGSLKYLPEIIGTQTAVSHTKKLRMFTNNSYRTLLRIVRVRSYFAYNIYLLLHIVSTDSRGV